MLVDHPEWDATVLAEVPGFLRDPICRSVAAARELPAMATQLPTTVPAWQIVEPLGSDAIADLLCRGSAAFRRAVVRAHRALLR